MPKLLDPVTPGEILREEFMAPYGLSANKLARELDVPPNRITGILAGQRTITADTALRLGTFFGTGAELWLNLQTRHDLEMARRECGQAIAERVRRIRTAA